MATGTLYIVSTPIGNLEDITLRALRVLKEADFIAAEDTRHSIKLLNHFGISKPMLSCWSQKEKVVSRDILDRIKGGKDCALITDAGTPGISDPGSHTIREALREGIRVVPVPGCSALIAALSISGLCSEFFMFLGFLPSKRGERIRKLEEVLEAKGTLIFYEAPHRIIESLSDMLTILGNRKAVLAREITKLHEEVLRGTLSEVLALVEGGVIAGEYVILLEGALPRQPNIKEALSETIGLISEGVSRKEAAKRIAHIYGLRSKDLYDMSMGGKSESN